MKRRKFIHSGDYYVSNSKIDLHQQSFLKLLVVFFLYFTSSITLFAQTNLYVDISGNDTGNDCTSQISPCASIQYAIDSAVSGDTINIASGSYSEDLVISTSGLMLSGSQAGVNAIGRSVSESSITGSIRITFSADSLTIDGLEIMEGNTVQGSKAGIYLEKNATNITIRNTIFSRSGDVDGDLYRGILSIVAGNNTDLIIQRNSFSGWATGIYLNPGAYGANILNNEFDDNYVGVSVDGPDSITISGNSFSDNVFEGLGLGPWTDGSKTSPDTLQAFVENNSFEGNTIHVGLYTGSGTKFDFSTNSFEGTTASSMSINQIITTEEKIGHGVDASGGYSGLALLRENIIAVTNGNSITTAFGFAEAEDSILVGSGTFDSFTIGSSGPDSLTFIGVSGAEISRDSSGSRRAVVDLRADAIKVEGFSIKGGNYHVGISVAGQHVIVNNNSIDSVLTGIQTTTQYVEGNATITGNTITNAGYGISLQNNSNTVTDNDITITTEGFGIGSASNTITGNIVSVDEDGIVLETYTTEDYDALPGADIDLSEFLENNTFTRAAYVVDESGIAIETVFGGIEIPVDSAAAGDSIFVLAGTYQNGNIIISKDSLSINAEEGVSGLDSVMLDGDISRFSLDGEGITMSVTGNSSNTLFELRGGNITVNGAAGVDTLLVDGNRSDFTITETENGVVITDDRSGSPNGETTLINIQRIVFANLEVSLVTGENNPFSYFNTYSTDFSDFDPGSISNGENGWLVSGGSSRDQEIVDIGGLRGHVFKMSSDPNISDFAGPYTASLTETAGETGTSANVNTIRTSFDFKAVSASPDSSRLEIDFGVNAGTDRANFMIIEWEESTRLRIAVNEPTTDGSWTTTNFAAFNGNRTLVQNIDTGSSAWHTLEMELRFVDGSNNDIIDIYLDGSYIGTTTTFENYWEFSIGDDRTTAAEKGVTSRLFFRPSASGAPSDGTGGKNQGFYFDNLNITSYDSNNPVSYPGNSLSFADNASKVIIPNSYALDFSSEFSVEGWVKINEFTSESQSIIQKGSDSWSIHRFSNSNTLGFSTWISGSHHILKGKTPLIDNEWHHVAVTFDGTNKILYIDGIQDTTESVSGSIDTNNDPISIGGWIGNIDELRMWSTARTADDIRNNVFQEIDANTSGLAGYWKIDEGSGNLLNDISSNGNDAGISPSSNIFWSSMAHPIGTYITGDEGWRIITSPANGVTYAELFQNIWTQGFTGADSETGDPNVYTYVEGDGDTDPSSRGFQAISSASDTATKGQAFIAYLYEDNDPFTEGTQGGFPKLIKTDSTQLSGEITLPLSLTKSGGGGTFDSANDGWNLIGNPYASSIDWDNDHGWIRTGLDDVVYVWSDSANNGSGAYLSWNGVTGTLNSGIIAPLQGFWVKANNSATPSISVKDTARSSGGTLLKKRAFTQIEFSIEGNGLQNKSIIMFSDDAELAKDSFDAYKLASNNPYWLSVSTTQSESLEQLDIQALPASFSTIDLNLNIDGSKLEGEYLLRWNPKLIPENWIATLFDLETSNEFSLLEKGFTSILLNSSYKEKEASPFNRVTIPKTLKKKATTTDRFRIILKQNTQTDIYENPDLPQKLELNQNYPNPFNPSTVIKFALPEQGLVSLTVFDLLGRPVARLVEYQKLNAGYHQVTFKAENLASGIYYYRLDTNQKTIIKQMTLIR